MFTFDSKISDPASFDEPGPPLAQEARLALCYAGGDETRKFPLDGTFPYNRYLRGSEKTGIVYEFDLRTSASLQTVQT